MLPRPSRPSVVLADLRAFLAARQRHELVFGAIAIAIPLLIISAFTIDAHFERAPPPIIYVQSWPLDRSDAEIARQVKIDGDKRRAREAKRRDEYRRVADQLGIKY
jgi:hypothetical protein